MRIFAISSNPSRIQCAVKSGVSVPVGNDTAEKPSFKGYEEAFSKISLRDISSVKDAAMKFYSLRNQLIADKSYLLNYDDIFEHSLLNGFIGIEKIFNGMKTKPLAFAVKDKRILGEIAPGKITFYYPDKQNAARELCFLNFSENLDMNSLEINEYFYANGITAGSEYLSFWKDTGNRKMFRDPHTRENIHYKKDGQPNNLRNFFFGAY